MTELPANVTEQVTAALENQVAEDMDWIDDDVPDPDMEDFLIAQTLPRNNSIFGRLSEYTLGRKSAAIPVVDKDVQQVDPDLNRKPSQMSFETDKDGHLQIPRPYLSADPTRSSSTKTVDSIKNENILNSATIKTIDRPFAENATIDRLSYVKTIDRPFMETYTLERADNPDALTRLGRFKTLPTNPHFRTPAFRSVPAWMPFRGIHMAWLVLITTSIVTIGNIIVNLIPQ
jgi:hypothetical protein